MDGKFQSKVSSRRMHLAPLNGLTKHAMRIFVYLLALLTDLTAAQSAGARHASPAALDIASPIWDAGAEDVSPEFAVSASRFSEEYGPIVGEDTGLKSNDPAPARLRVVYRGDRSRE